MIVADLQSRPQRAARVCGAFYLYIIAAGMFAELFVRAQLVVPRDASATAANLLAHETRFRAGAAGELLHVALDVVVAVLLYGLLRHVDRGLALLAALTRTAADVVLGVSSLAQFLALRLLHAGASGAGLAGAEREELALLMLRVHGDGYAVCLIFFAFTCLALGPLVRRSGFLPWVFGPLLSLAGACYLVTSFAHLLTPTLAGHLFPWFYLPPFLAELSLALWLLIRGVDVAKWRAGIYAPR
jgi:hypothetical protein